LSTDDPLAGVTVPVSTGANPAAGEPSHLQEVHAELAGRTLPPGVPKPVLRTADDFQRFIDSIES
jgi:phospholipase C